MNAPSLPRTVLSCAVVFLCAAAAAQQQQQSTPSKTPPSNQDTAPQAPVVRITTRLVQVNVVVQDGKGQPIGDLKREDFTVLDDGIAQAISTFSMESSAAVHDAPPALPPNTFSNRLEQRAGVPTSVTIVLMDQLNTRFTDNVYARDQVVKFLSQIQPNDRVALYHLGSGLRILHDFTADASRLVRALARHKGGEEPALASSEPEPADTGNTELDDWLNNANERISDFYLRNRVVQTTAALEAIANHIAPLPGRKNLVWVSGSFPVSFGFDRLATPGNLSPNSGTFTYEIERAARALNNANVAIYPVDARGLVVGGFSAASPGPRTARGPAPNPFPGLPGLRLTHETMNLLAERTGGRAFYNTNDINGSIRRAIADSRVTYVLGYYPTHGKWDGRFRELKVRVNRAGARLRHRKGYIAFAEQPPTEQERHSALRAAARSPLDASAIGIIAQVTRVQAAGSDLLNVALKINGRDVTLHQEGGRWLGTVDVLFMQRGNEGRELTGDIRNLDINLSQERYLELSQRGILFTGKLGVARGAEELRIVIRDSTSTAAGSVVVPFARLVEN